jgi:hypothetical protein
MPKPSSLTRFAVQPAAQASTEPAKIDATDTSSSADATNGRGRGKNPRVGVAVRLGHEDWYRLHDLAVREHTSLQSLIVRGLSALMEERGLPPLTGH